MEKKLAEFSKSHNLLIDANSALEKEVHRLSLKVLDLEDRSRRNYILIRGIPKSVLPDQLSKFLTDFMVLNLDLTID